jgi:hypothetical protein
MDKDPLAVERERQKCNEGDRDRQEIERDEAVVTSINTTGMVSEGPTRGLGRVGLQGASLQGLRVRGSIHSKHDGVQYRMERRVFVKCSRLRYSSGDRVGNV